MGMFIFFFYVLSTAAEVFFVTAKQLFLKSLLHDDCRKCLVVISSGSRVEKKIEEIVVVMVR